MIASVSDIRERYQRYGWSLPPGEWGHIQNGPRRELHTALDAGDTTALDEIFGSMFTHHVCVGLVSAGCDISREKLTDWFRANIQLWSLYSDSTDLSILDAPDIGNPTLAYVDGSSVMPDTPRHDHYAQRILALKPKTVLELGGGFGGLALQIMRRSDDTRVIICDLPETLYLAWYWLSRATDRTVGWYGEGDADITLLPAQNIDTLEGKIDVVFSSHSLSEMDAATVARYIGFVEARARYFYHDNAHKRLNASGAYASEAFPEVLATSMVPKGFREVYRAPTSWAGSGERYWEFLYERKENK